jgi:hypothetical protein
MQKQRAKRKSLSDPYRSSTVVNSIDVHNQKRWPQFTRPISTQSEMRCSTGLVTANFV